MKLLILGIFLGLFISRAMIFSSDYLHAKYYNTHDDKSIRPRYLRILRYVTFVNVNGACLGASEETKWIYCENN